MNGMPDLVRHGQWLGRAQGTNPGIIVLNLDQQFSSVIGTVHLFPEDLNDPWIQLSIDIPNDKDVWDAQIVPNIIDPISRNIISLNQSGEDGSLQLPKLVNLKLEFKIDKLYAGWTTDVDTKGICELSHSKIGDDSIFQPKTNIKTWNEFRDYVLTFEHLDYVYRGQPNQKKLSTSFHRTNRSDLNRYMIDINSIHKLLNYRTNNTFNMYNPDDYGAFYGLIQHHGFPTPLLDWSYSPFVAAFFAYRSLRTITDDEFVRIFIFDKKKWENSFSQELKIFPSNLHVSFLEISTISNPRHIPQQSVSMMTNISDIEHYLKFAENLKKLEFLEVIDLPVSERLLVMKNLNMMGINAGSLFPGIDGDCEALKERFFRAY
jgi:hypothetical protein